MLLRRSTRLLSLSFLLVLPRVAAAQEGVQDYFGSFTNEVPIAVPAYHGLEPAVKLVYNSGGGNGYVGVGWSLAAGSSIVRAAPNMGTPRYDTSDIYLFDGQPLVADTSLGGTHSTRVQSYLRITKNAD